jgi:D-sedoheptulose 7-phosphate isomerase
MSIVQTRIRESIKLKQQILDNDLFISTIEQAAQAVIDCFRNGHRVFLCGNGGSAADAQHLAAELSGRYYFDRPPLPAEALHVNTSYLTAVGNDYSYDVIYSRYISGTGQPGDVLIGLSTSGNSPNIVNAARKAKELEMTVIAFTGESGGKLKFPSDFLFNVPSKDTARIQEAHITIGHILCEIIESTLFQEYIPKD